MTEIRQLEERMEQYRKEGFPKIWVADNGDGTYTNPILHSDYSDPDIVKVGDDYFMVASSFNCCPGFPLLHSRDLVNWELINYVIDELPIEGYDKPQHGQGVWAPSIRYHDGYYWVFVGMPDEGIYMSKTQDPFGQWEPLHCVKKAKGWIDTCPFWDDDGKAYLVNGFARSRIGFKSVLGISRMEPDGSKLLDEFRIVIDGNVNHPTIEGPKMYKRNGYYYISAPAGGVATGYQVVLRSTNVYGPYEERIVLHQGETEINGPHQGGWVDIDEEESWFVHFQDKEAFGRIVHLQPMHWVDDWPVMGHHKEDSVEPGEPVIRHKKPNLIESPISVPKTSDDFVDMELGLQWQWPANPSTDWYDIHDSRLYLKSRKLADCDYNGLWAATNLLLQKFPALSFQVTAKMDIGQLADGDQAGLVVMGYDYWGLMVGKQIFKETSYNHLFLLQGNGPRREEVQLPLCPLESQVTTVYMRVIVDENQWVRLFYSIDGDTFIELPDKFKATKGQWIGSKFGLGCVNRDKETTGVLSCDWVLVEEV